MPPGPQNAPKGPRGAQGAQGLLPLGPGPPYPWRCGVAFKDSGATTCGFYTRIHTKIMQNKLKWVQVAPYGLILRENLATASGKPLECPKPPKTPPKGSGFRV